ncbi:hypothetical protein GGR57DRAFT_512033 [Xylariaceae sp. FL1272]|nr:hypothetical protein GGR57DRAFT_512033 [Xylariaceae sp. FL1272]
MASPDYKTIQDLIDDPLPKLRCNAAGSISTTRNSGWPKLVELEAMENFTPTLVRETIGNAILQSKTDLTLANVERTIRWALPFCSSRQADGLYSEDNDFLPDKSSFIGFCAPVLGSFLTSMFEAIGQVKEDPYAKWFLSGQLKPHCDAVVGFLSPQEGYKTAVVGQTKLSKDWRFKNIKPALGEGIDVVKRMKQSDRNPVRQLVSNALAYGTCWAFIHTEEEVVLARVYKVRETDALLESLKGYKEYRDAEDECLGIEMMSIPWQQPRGPDTLSMLEGLFLWSVLSFHDDYRELVFKDELPPMTQVLGEVKRMLQPLS